MLTSRDTESHHQETGSEPQVMKTCGALAPRLWRGYGHIARPLCALIPLVAVLLTGCGKGFMPAPDFTMALTPGALSIEAGAPQQFSLKATSVNGFAGTVEVNITGLPPGVSGSGTIVLAPGISQQITLIAAPSASLGSATIDVEGRSGTLVHVVAVSIDVMPPPQDFSVAATPSDLSLQAGGAAQKIMFTVNGINGFTSPVETSVTGAPAGIMATPSSLSLNPGTAGQITRLWSRMG